jgi:outer membrane biosynthesis protein TonB
MKIKLNVTNADELRALAIFIRNLADSYDRYPTPTGLVNVAADPPAHPFPPVEAKMEPEPKPEPVEKKRRGRPPRRAATADENAEYAAAAERATEYTAKRVTPEPEPSEEPVEVQAADVADEAAESAAIKAEDPKLTHDDIRQELGAYMKKYGMPAAQEDGPRLFKIIFPDATPAKISDIPGTQEDLNKVLAGIREMSAKNPYARTVISA